MKSKKYKIAAIYTMLVLAGCNPDLLDREPDFKYTESNFWQTEATANAALTSVYAVLTGNGLFGGDATPLWEEGATPNAYCYSGGTLGYDAIGRSQQSASTEGIIANRWAQCYQGIGRANTFFARVGDVGLDAEKQNLMEGQVYFLRALYYFELATYYGGVPLILEAPNPDTQVSMPRNSREEVIAQVIADLNTAVEKLPVKHAGGDLGRATKGAAMALKARVLLYEASPLLNPSNSSEKWQAAADAAKAVLDLAPAAGYDLFGDYRKLFLPENENNKEVIFDVQFLFPDEGHSFDLINTQYNSNAPLQDLVDTYDMKNGLPITDPGAGYDPAKPYENRDPRLAATVVYPGSLFKGEVASADYYKQTGYAMKKYSIYDAEKPPKDKSDLKSGQSETNFIVLRYADILMMYAEALNEIDPGNPAILENLNKIRKRVGMPEIPSNKSQSEMRELIRKERRIEFAGEALYYNDIRRWKIAEVVMNAPIKTWQNNIIETRKFNPARDYWWPIAQKELDLNSKLEQNPNY